jgi:hypothetical protein
MIKFGRAGIVGSWLVSRCCIVRGSLMLANNWTKGASVRFVAILMELDGPIG